MKKVRLTVTESHCRDGLCRAGDVFIADGCCPPLCQELWHAAYPFVYALQNGGLLDSGDTRAASFDIFCPDGGRVRLHGEVIAP